MTERRLSVKTYTVEINGLQITRQFSDEDADRLGLTADPVTKVALAPQNKARTVSNKLSE